MTRLLLILATVLLTFNVAAETETKQPPADDQPSAEEESAETTEGLDLFDGDVEDTRSGWSQLWVSAGVMNLDAKGQFRAQLPNGQRVTIIDFERIGLKENDSTPWATLNWRSRNSRWGAWAAAWRYEVDGARMWEADLPLPEGGSIPAGALVESSFDTKWYIIEATYSIWRSETVDAGIGFGFHTVDLETSLLARVEIGEQEKEVVSGDIDTLAPLPNLVGYGVWRVGQRWQFTLRGGWFGLSYGDYSGQMVNAYALASFDLSERWAIGGGYQFIRLDLDVEDEDVPWTQIYDIDYAGPMAFLRFRF